MNVTVHRSKQIARAIILLATLLASGSVCPAQQQDRLTKIEFVGLKRLTAEQLIVTSELKVGQMVDATVINAAAGKLMQSGLFNKLTFRVRGTAGQVTVIFEVEEANRSLPVVFENFVWFSDDELTSAIRNEIPFFNGLAPEVGDTTDKIAAALQHLLNEKKIPGRVEVMPHTDIASGRQEILFAVKGVKLPVCSLRFSGTEAISEAELIKASQPMSRSDYSKTDIVAFAKATLFPLYRHLGRLRAQFQEPTATLATDSPNCAGGVEVTVPVVEGVAYSWAEAEWVGNKNLPAAELATAIGMKAGEVADGLKIDRGLIDLRKAYGRKGYLTVRMKDSSEFDDSAQRVVYRFTIQEGPQYHMGNLIINGLAPELVQELKGYWNLASGAVFDESYIDEFRLNALPKFVGTQMQRSSAFRARVVTDTAPDAQKLTVDVVITFK